MTMPPPEKLEVQIVDMQHRTPFQFLTSLLRRRGGWFANHLLLPPRPAPSGFIPGLRRLDRSA